jgi:hypothetical protein
LATSFEKIYDCFWSQISDPVLLKKDTDDALVFRFLQNSIPKFKRCQKDLSRRNESEFEEDLSDEEILILGTLMVIEYLNPQIITLENIKHAMGSRDFNLSSQATFLQSLISLRDMKKSEVNKLIIDYTYNNGNLKDLR